VTKIKYVILDRLRKVISIRTKKIIVCVFDMRSVQDQTGTKQHYDDAAMPIHVALYSNTEVAFD